MSLVGLLHADGFLRLGLALAMSALALSTGCDQVPGEAPTADDEASEDPVDAEGDLLALDGECRSQEEGYVVASPQPWYVSDGEHLPPCSAFDPNRCSSRTPESCPPISP